MGRMGARAVIEYGGKYLLVRNKVSEDFWCLPGGGIEPGEEIIPALRRELIEETGIEPDVGNLLYVHQIESADGFGTPEFFFHVKNAKDYLAINLKATSHGELELAEIAFTSLKDAVILPKFLKTELPELKEANFNLPTRVRISRLTN
ncbi:MAG: NUDIX hydrolase [Candidatus Saccharimonadales bacterium]|jgi:8-oxo-dGTP pyrophosphatase MutT (NUDIX family)